MSINIGKKFEIEENIYRSLDKIAIEADAGSLDDQTVVDRVEHLRKRLAHEVIEAFEKKDYASGYSLFHVITESLKQYAARLVARQSLGLIKFNMPFYDYINHLDKSFTTLVFIRCCESDDPILKFDSASDLSQKFIDRRPRLFTKEAVEEKQINSGESDALTMKQQILLLQSLGVFSLSILEVLPTKKIGLLFGRLLNKSSKNVEDTFRNRFDKNQFSKKDLEKVSAILKEAGLEKL